MADLVIRVSAVDGAEGPLKRLSETLKGIGTSASQSSASLSALGESFRKMGNVAGGLIAYRVIESLGGAIRAAFSDASNAIMVQAQLNAVLASTSHVAGVTAEQVNAYADQMHLLVPIDDDAIRSTENLLLTFTGIDKSIFQPVTESVLDLSIALGEDTKNAAIQVGKALQDPTKGLIALRRVGVAFNDQQAQAVKNMVEAGNMAGAQAVILRELQREFGGSAQAAGGTFGGQLKILGNVIRDVSKDFLVALLPAVQGLSQHLIPLIDDFGKKAPAAADAFINRVKAIWAATEGGRAAVVNITKDILGLLDVVRQIVSLNWQPLLIGIGSFVILTTVVAPLIGTLAGTATAIGLLVPTIAAVASGAITFAEGLGLIGVAVDPVILVIAAVAAAIGLLALAWSQNWGHIQDATMTVVNWFRDTAGPAINGFVNGVANAFIDMINSVVSNLPQMVVQFSKTINDMLGFLDKIPTPIRVALGFTGITSGLEAVKAITGFVSSGQPLAHVDIGAAVGGGITGAKNAVGDAIGGLTKGVEDKFGDLFKKIRDIKFPDIHIPPSPEAETGAQRNAALDAFKQAIQSQADLVNSLKERLGELKGQYDDLRNSVLLGTQAFKDQQQTLSEASDHIKLQIDLLKLQGNHQAQIAQLQKRLDKEGLKSEIVGLQESISLGPQRAAIARTTAAPERAFTDIITGLQSLKPQMEALTNVQGTGILDVNQQLLKVMQQMDADITSGKATKDVNITAPIVNVENLVMTGSEADKESFLKQIGEHVTGAINQVIGQGSGPVPVGATARP